MTDYQSLSHTKGEGKDHVVFIPKGRRTALSGHLRAALGEVFRELARQKESKVEEGHLRPDHVHMLLSIPPKYAVAQVMGYLKGKSAIYMSLEKSGGDPKDSCKLRARNASGLPLPSMHQLPHFLVLPHF